MKISYDAKIGPLGYPNEIWLINVSQNLIFDSCPEAMGHQLSASCYQNDEICETPLDSLHTSNLRYLPGLFSFEIKGAGEPLFPTPEVQIVGEFVVGRAESNTIKYYNYLIAATNLWVYFGKPVKKFNNHHIDFLQWTGSQGAFGHAYRTLPI